MTSLSQSGRPLKVYTPLGENHFVLKSVAGADAVSQLFHYELELLSEDPSIDPAEMIGQNVTFFIEGSDGILHPFNGYVNRFWYDGSSDQATCYRATLIPWLWFLTQTTDCRIFQNRSVPEILEEVFRDFPSSQFLVNGLLGEYPRREYCVQYRESDFDFVSRLMEEEGIFYFWQHENGQHTLHLADSVDAYFDVAHDQVAYPKPGHASDYANCLTEWRHEYRLCSGKVAHTDFDFKAPFNKLASDAVTVISNPTAACLERFEYPGRFDLSRRGRELARRRMEEIETRAEEVKGSSNYESWRPAGKFQIAQHRTAKEVGRQYVLLAVEFKASVDGAYITGTSEGELSYENRFTGIPAETLFRPARVTSQAIVEGPQTAMVVGPQMANGKPEEIYTDEEGYGMVKVQFHWDRRGRFDDKSSCWIRVSQGHAGKGFGGIDLPRIGEEVIVDFLEGDPDRPIITGRVYNGENRPPFNLPAEKTRSGLKTNTYQGSGTNEISLDDTAGAEQIRMNAQYDMNTTVGNNQSLIVKVNRKEDIGKNDELVVGKDRKEDVTGNKEVKVGGDMKVDVGKKLKFTAGSSITLKCGAAKITMNSSGVINITGTIINTTAAANAAIAAPMTQVVGALLNTAGGMNVMSGVTCRVASASLTSLSGGKVDVAADGTTDIKGSQITLN